MKTRTNQNHHRFIYLAVILAALSTVTVQGQLSLTNGLVAYYPFNGSANDASGNGLNGNPVNITYTTNRFGIATNSVLLSGSSSYVGVNYATNFNFSPSGQFTLSAWFKLNGFGSGSGGIGSLIVKGPSTGVWDYGLECPEFEKYVLWAGLSAESPCVSTNILQLGNWYHGVVTYSNALWQLYLNGVLLVTTNTSYKITQSTGGIAIGRKGEASTDNFNGAIDDVRIYSRALTANEVAQLYSIESTLQPIGIATYSNNPVIFYPSSGTNYNLQMTTNLSSPVWVTVTNGVPFSAVEITNAPSNAFFRLAN
jgi:hypothetical protein